MRTLADDRVMADLIARLERLGPEAERRWGTLTAPEMLCHLADVSRSILGGPKSGTATHKPRRVMKWLALYSPIPWPKARIRTPAEVDPHAKGTRPVEFERDRAGAISAVRALATAPPESFPPSHFMFGAMAAKDWQRWGYLHTDHHLRQFGH